MRYITAKIRSNGSANGKTEILDTTIDGGEGDHLIVALFHDHAEAVKFCAAANAHELSSRRQDAGVSRTPPARMDAGEAGSSFSGPGGPEKELPLVALGPGGDFRELLRPCHRCHRVFSTTAMNDALCGTCVATTFDLHLAPGR